MSDANFSDYITRERERLNADRERIVNEQEELQKKLDGINREFQAIEAYEAAKTGKAAPRQSGARQTRARRVSKREQLFEVIRQGNGLSRGEILAKMGLKGDKSGEMSVSNALTALSKTNQVRRDGGKIPRGL